ncbi:MAG: GRRM system radical SAM/SPASM domain protein [Burkholderiales bacterium]|nr:GRRM system radical SAM/SPASM domain protein [Burkholderiales bacterium]
MVQPTTFCNINCTYCYLPERSVKKRMELRTVELLGERILQSGWTADDVTVVWHAGEPLVVPPEWYERAFAVLARHCPPKVRLAQAVQTNGTLIDASWVRLFKAHDVRVGVSLDGPRVLHDSRRRSRNGRGTYDRTMAGIRYLLDAGLPFHVITVLTSDSLACADELFEFYQAEGIKRVCFNVEEIEGVNQTSSLDAKGTDASFRAFLSRFLERVANAPRPFWVRELATSVAMIMATPDVIIPNQQVEPLAILTIDVDGNLSTFSPELIGSHAPEFDDFRFVNLKDGGPEALLAAPGFRRAHAAIVAGVDACRNSCPWFRWCGGGAPANKLSETGSLAATETLYCRLTKQAVMDVVLSQIEAGRLPGMEKAA